MDALGFSIRNDPKSMWIVTWLEDQLRRGDNHGGGHGIAYVSVFSSLFPPPLSSSSVYHHLRSVLTVLTRFVLRWCRSRSNEDEESKYFLRTKSANETLLRAQEIRTDSYMHTSPTDVDGDVAPDTNLGGAQDVYDDMHSV